MESKEMWLTSKGQVTIPKAFREAIGVHPNSPVRFELKNGTLIISGTPHSKRGNRPVDALRGTATTGLTTNEIMRMTRGEDAGDSYRQ